MSVRKGAAQEPPPALRFRSVLVSYNGRADRALDGVDLTIRPGERVALVGPSGAGKSTLVSLANGLTLPTQGTVEVFGLDTRELARRRHRTTRRRIGTVHQGFALVGPLRVAHNVAAGGLGRWGSWRALRSLIRPAELDEIVGVLEQVGIAGKLWDRADQLSGGQQQRVAIARAMFQRPDLLLADEPLSSLDPAWSEAILGVLLQACAGEDGRTLLACLHDAPLARTYAERVIGLRDGRVAFDRKATDVTSELLDELYSLEAGSRRDGTARPARSNNSETAPGAL